MRIDNLKPGIEVVLGFNKYTSPDYYEDKAKFLGIYGEGKDRKAKFESVISEGRYRAGEKYTWSAYRYFTGKTSHWAFGTGADYLRLVSVVE